MTSVTPACRSWWRSRAMWLCRVLTAVGGGICGHRALTSVSWGTVVPGCSASRAMRVRWPLPRKSTRPSGPATSTGPRTRMSNPSGMCPPRFGHETHWLRTGNLPELVWGKDRLPARPDSDADGIRPARRRSHRGCAGRNRGATRSQVVGAVVCAVTKSVDTEAKRTEAVLAGTLADVLRVERVPVDSHFFDDLAANSLVMAHFCALVRKRADLPSM